MKHFFTFSKSQKVGVVAIVVVIFIQIIILNKGNAVGVPDPFVVDKSDYLIEEGSSYYTKTDVKSKDSDNVNYAHVLYDFDPNVVSKEDWVSFGFSQKQAQSILSYKTKIGGFKQKEDLKKVYVISSEKYTELEPFIKFQSGQVESVDLYDNKSEVNEKIQLKIEINSAQEADLVKVKGIGEYTAKEIIKYKISLGGFHNENQLKEVYGVSDDNFKLIKPQIEIDPGQIVKLNVNKLSVPELKKHPYISWTIANTIIDKRLIQKLNSIQFLVEEDYLSQEDYNNLLPYVVYE